MKRISILVCCLGLAAIAPAQSVARYVGADGDWFNPRNWSTGRVPDRTTDVVIGGDAYVVIDPARAPGPVVIRDLLLRGKAWLETRPGTTFLSRHEIVAEDAYLYHRSTLAGSSAPDGSIILTTYNGWHLNPSPQIKRNVILKTSVTTNLALGGALAASAAGQGRGHYANVVADLVVLGGRLNVRPMYDFQPLPGQSFQIVTVNRWRIGQFRGLPEGALAGRIGGVGLYITYEGGDGNDVVLHARALPATP